MIVQIPIQVRVILDKLAIVDKTRLVAKLPCEARVSRQKAAHIAVCRIHIPVHV